MANTNAPFGLRPIARIGGTPFSLTRYAHLAADSTAIFRNDVVAKISGGAGLDPDVQTATYAQQVASAYHTSYAPAVGTGPWLGVAADYCAASALGMVHIYDEPDALFLVQGKTGTTYSTASHVGKNANISLTTAGSATTKQGAMAVDGATINTTNTLDLRLRSISMIVPNAEGDSAIFEVTINNHIYSNLIAGV